MAEKKEPDFRKYLVSYLSRFQREPYKGLEDQPGLDIFRPFKFVWFILARIWSGIFGGRR